MDIKAIHSYLESSNLEVIVELTLDKYQGRDYYLSIVYDNEISKYKVLYLPINIVDYKKLDKYLCFQFIDQYYINYLIKNINDFKDDTVKEFVTSAEKAGKTSKEALLMASKTHKLPARGPMPWDNERNNGFTDKEPWIKGKKLDETNAADEITDDSSMFNFYKKLISLKKEQLFQEGNYYLWPTSNGSYVYERNLKDKKALIAVSLSHCCTARIFQIQ